MASSCNGLYVAADIRIGVFRVVTWNTQILGFQESRKLKFSRVVWLYDCICSNYIHAHFYLHENDPSITIFQITHSCVNDPTVQSHLLSYTFL